MSIISRKQFPSRRSLPRGYPKPVEMDVERLAGLLAEYRRMQHAQGFTPQSRGQRLNGLIAEMLQCWGLEARHSVRSAGEIDAVFVANGNHYILEAKWEKSPADTGQLAKLQKRLRQRFVGTYGIFLSIHGFSREALADLTHGERLEVLLLDETHLEAMLSGRLSPQRLLSQLHSHASWYGDAYVPMERLNVSTAAVTVTEPQGLPHEPSSYPVTDAWQPVRADRGNPPGEFEAFPARSGVYWVITALEALLILALTCVLATPGSSLWLRIGLILLVTFVVALAFGTARMALTPLRLEIGSQGIQVFGRTETNWFPWEILDRVEVTRLEGGNVYVVAWCNVANRFPEFNRLEPRPRYIRKLGAVTICPLNILRARRHMVVRALHAYGGNRIGHL